jgi:hypothetical protein
LDQISSENMTAMLGLTRQLDSQLFFPKLI